MNADSASYHVPVKTDVHEFEAILAQEDEPYVNALGIVSAGEIGTVGSVASIADVIWRATGKRIGLFLIPKRIH